MKRLNDKDNAASSIESDLLTLIQLEQKIRSAQTVKEWYFGCLNEPISLLDYQQSYLWVCASKRLVGASGLAELDSNAPFCSWLSQLIQFLLSTEKADRIHDVKLSDLSSEDAQQFVEYFTNHVIWLPIKAPDGHLIAILLMSRETSLSLREKKLLDFLTAAYGHAGVMFEKRSKGSKWLKKKTVYLFIITCVSLLLAFIPVRQSVIAPADVVPKQPLVLRSPMDGAIGDFKVEPNDNVKQGQLIARLDSKALQQELENARQSYQIAKAELRMTRQQSFIDAQRKATIAILQGKLMLAESKLKYFQQQLVRTQIIAPKDGVVIFDNAADWLGKPVGLGDAIMTLANPDEITLEISLPLDDLIDLTKGTPVKFFLNSDPSQPVNASITNLAYQASQTKEGLFALQITADFVDHDKPLRLGNKGVAKLYGESTSLFYYLFRKPLSTLRLWLMW